MRRTPFGLDEPPSSIILRIITKGKGSETYLTTAARMPHSPLLEARPETPCRKGYPARDIIKDHHGIHQPPSIFFSPPPPPLLPLNHAPSFEIDGEFICGTSEHDSVVDEVHKDVLKVMEDRDRFFVKGCVVRMVGGAIDRTMCRQRDPRPLHGKHDGYKTNRRRIRYISPKPYLRLSRRPHAF